MIARRVIVRGRVQGVGYRDATIEAATALGVAGWVRNVHDGTVEAWLQGDATAVERAIHWCRRGPPAARVTAVEVAESAVDERLAAFTMKPSV